jgi:hypothetical protein
MQQKYLKLTVAEAIWKERDGVNTPNLRCIVAGTSNLVQAALQLLKRAGRCKVFTQ